MRELYEARLSMQTHEVYEREIARLTEMNQIERARAESAEQALQVLQRQASFSEPMMLSQCLPRRHNPSPGFGVNINEEKVEETLCKVESAIQAVRSAVQNMHEGP
jgi:hypothetical protein